MSVDRSPIFLLRTETDEPVNGEIWDQITDHQIADWENEWLPNLAANLTRMQKANIQASRWPQNDSWHWKEKTEAVKGFLAFPSMCVVCDEVTQGMMSLDTSNRRCQIPSQRNKDLAYIRWMEVAPWNRKELMLTPRFRGVGRLLVGAAIQLSIHDGFKGRVGLHALPASSNIFTKYGMTDCGIDTEVKNLRYFEMTPEQAAAFIEKGNQP